MSIPTIGDQLTALAAQSPTRPAITCGDDTVTRAELESRANRLARNYDALGVRQGDFVSIGLPNGIEFFEACFAVWKLGAIPQPVPAGIAPHELTQILDLASPTLLVGFPDNTTAALPSGIPTVARGFQPDPTLADTPLPSRVSPAWKAPTSGGSTGRPKLIVAGRSSEIDPDSVGSIFRLHRDQVQLIPGPLHHNGPFAAAMIGLLLGHHLVVQPRFDATAALRAITKYRVQYVNFVPTMLLRMVRVLDADPESFDLSSLETVWHSAAPCPAWLKQRWIELVGADRLYENYGATEAQAVTVISGTEWLTHRGSVGRAVLGEISIVDDHGRPAPAGEVGQIAVRRPTGTAPTYHYLGAEPPAGDNGWELVGDLGHLDTEGYLYLADRRTDLILRGGANIYPAEVEAAIAEHPQVLSCAVIGLSDEDLGQRVHALVYTGSNDLDEPTLRAFVSTRLARYKQPETYRFVDTPLRDEAGKVRRAALRAAEQERLTR
ncbi:AMP-binding protein [Nocardia tengchongensis]|uniref:AMP-binding protein n=1 Tax=Nocardia tengchongensis TaxID=2055889 RepID=UPI00369F491F